MSTHVLHLLTRLNVGGPARHVLQVANRLGPGMVVTLAAGSVEAGEGEMEHAHVAVRRLPLARSIRPASDFRAVRATRRLLAELGDVAILHTHMAKAGLVGRLAARSTGTTTVHTFHGHVLRGYFSPPAERAFLEAERRLARRTDVLVAVSGLVRDELLDLGVGRADQYRVIPAGSDLTPFLAIGAGDGSFARSLGVPDGARTVGILGRFAPIKDHATFLRAVADTTDDVHAILLGDGELRPDLEQQVSRLGIGARVHFAGWRRDVSRAMADLDVVVCSSRNEGTPLALIEAAAAGRPVVSTDVGGVRDVVVAGVTGLLVPPDSAEALADAIVRLLDDAAERAKMGAAGRAHVRTRFDLMTAAGALRDLYVELGADGR